MSTSNLAVVTEPNLNTLNPKVYREDLVEQMFNAGLEYLSIMPSSDFVNLTNGHYHTHLNLRNFMLGISIRAYAAKNDLVYEDHFGYENSEIERTGFLLASKASPPTYIHVQPGEDSKRFVRCFELQAGLVLKHSGEKSYLLSTTRYDKYNQPVVYLSGETVQGDCLKYIDPSILKGIQTYYLETLQKSQQECENILKSALEEKDPFKRYLDDYIHNMNRMEVLFGSLFQIKDKVDVSTTHLEPELFTSVLENAYRLNKMIPASRKNIETLLQQRKDIENSTSYKLSQYYKENSSGIRFIVLILLVAAAIVGGHLIIN